MLLLWVQGSPYWQVGLAYALLGIGVGLFGTPASHSLTASVPVKRVGMASGTADLQRDLGGAIMQSIFGALLTAGYAAAVASAIAAAPNKAQITSSVHWAYAAGVIATVVGIALVFFLFPRKDDEQRLLAEYQKADAGLGRAEPAATLPE